MIRSDRFSERVITSDAALRTIEENRSILEVAVKQRNIKIGVDNA